MILVINTLFHLHGLMVLLGLPVATPLRSNLFNTPLQPLIKKSEKHSHRCFSLAAFSTNITS